MAEDNETLRRRYEEQQAQIARNAELRATAQREHAERMREVARLAAVEAARGRVAEGS